jgi:hypothetical protein
MKNLLDDIVNLFRSDSRAHPHAIPSRPSTYHRGIARLTVVLALAALTAMGTAPVASARIVKWATDPAEMVKLCNAAGGTGNYDSKTGVGTCDGKDGGYTICVTPNKYSDPNNCTTSTRD